MVVKERLFCGSSTSTVCSGTDLRNGTSSKLNGLMWPLLQIIGSTTCKHRSMHRGTHTHRKRDKQKKKAGAGENELKEEKTSQELHCLELITMLTPYSTRSQKQVLICGLGETQAFRYKALHEFVTAKRRAGNELKGMHASH